MRARRASPLTEATIVCAQAGNVNTGAFDPFAEIAERAREAGAWVHVDGAFGLWAAAAPRRAHLLEGSALADSWATDAHKWLNVPYDSGLAFVRDADALRAAMAVTAEYLPAPSGVRNPSRLHARALAPRARRRGLGGAALARPLRRGGARRAHLPACAAVRRRAGRGRVRGPQRRRAESGARVVRRRRDDASA